VPELTRMWQHISFKYFHGNPLCVDGNSPLGLIFEVTDPSFIGADLVMNAYAAWKKYQQSCIICDLGTATTIQLVTRQGRFLGTVIAPGIRTAANHMFEKAALLSEIELTTPPHILGTNTRDAMLSGIVTGHAYMLEGFISRIKSEYAQAQPFMVIATGGIADLIAPLVPAIEIVDKTLTLDGLNLAARYLLGDGS